MPIDATVQTMTASVRTIVITNMMNMAVALTAIAQVAGPLHIFGVNGRPILCVPESDMDRSLLRYADESTDLHVGSGRTPGFAFLFTSKTMRSIIGGYHLTPGFEGHPYVNQLSGSIGFLGQDDQTRFGPAMRARDTEDIWYTRGKCTQPTVRSVDPNLYEVKCDVGSGYGAIWNQRPDPKTVMPNANEIVVATCEYHNLPVGPYEGKTLRTCTRVVAIDGFLVSYRLQQDNVKFFSNIDSMIASTVLQWKRNCTL
jgi:hypothetical protein